MCREDSDALVVGVPSGKRLIIDSSLVADEAAGKFIEISVATDGSLIVTFNPVFNRDFLKEDEDDKEG